MLRKLKLEKIDNKDEEYNEKKKEEVEFFKKKVKELIFVRLIPQYYGRVGTFGKVTFSNMDRTVTHFTNDTKKTRTMISPAFVSKKLLTNNKRTYHLKFQIENQSKYNTISIGFSKKLRNFHRVIAFSASYYANIENFYTCGIGLTMKNDGKNTLQLSYFDKGIEKNEKDKKRHKIQNEKQYSVSFLLNLHQQEFVILVNNLIVFQRKNVLKEILSTITYTCVGNKKELYCSVFLKNNTKITLKKFEELDLDISNSKKLNDFIH